MVEITVLYWNVQESKLAMIEAVGRRMRIRHIRDTRTVAEPPYRDDILSQRRQIPPCLSRRGE
jgi:hypothetical protein